MSGDGRATAAAMAQEDSELTVSRLGQNRTGKSYLAVEKALLLLSFGFLVSVLAFAGAAYARGASGTFISDEGIPAYGAARVLNGELPYRDFWAIYGPAQFYTLAALFKLFGPSLAVERGWDLVARAGTVLVAYALTRQLAGRRAALASTVISSLWLATASFSGYPMFPALLMALLAMLLASRYFQNGQLGWLAGSGLACSLTTLYRHDVGVCAAAAVGLTLFVALICSNCPPGKPILKQMTPTFIPVTFFASEVLLLLAPLVIYFGTMAGWKTLWENFYVYPSIVPEVRALPRPLLPGFGLPELPHDTISEYLGNVLALSLPFYGLLALYSGVIVLAARRLDGFRVRTSTSARIQGILALTLLGVGLISQALSRYDWIHLLPTSIVGLIVASSLSPYLPRRSDTKGLAWSIRLLLPPTFILLLIPPVVTGAVIWQTALPPVCLSDLPRAACNYVPHDQEAAIQWIQQHVEPDERIFVGLDRHDQVFQNDVMFYFLSGHHSATVYHEMEPGLTTTWAVQNAIVDDLRRSAVRYVVLFSGFSPDAALTPIAHNEHATLLDEFIGANYHPLITFGNYSIWSQP